MTDFPLTMQCAARTGFVKVSLTDGKKLWFKADSFAHAASQVTLPFGQRIVGFMWVSETVYKIALDAIAIGAFDSDDS